MRLSQPLSYPKPLFVRIGGEYFHNLLENTWDQYVNTLTKD